MSNASHLKINIEKYSKAARERKSQIEKEINQLSIEEELENEIKTFYIPESNTKVFNLGKINKKLKLEKHKAKTENTLNNKGQLLEFLSKKSLAPILNRSQTKQKLTTDILITDENQDHNENSNSKKIINANNNNEDSSNMVSKYKTVSLTSNTNSNYNSINKNSYDVNTIQDQYQSLNTDSNSNNNSNINNNIDTNSNNINKADIISNKNQENNEGRILITHVNYKKPSNNSNVNNNNDLTLPNRSQTEKSLINNLNNRKDKKKNVNHLNIYSNRENKSIRDFIDKTRRIIEIKYSVKLKKEKELRMKEFMQNYKDAIESSVKAIELAWEQFETEFLEKFETYVKSMSHIKEREINKLNTLIGKKLSIDSLIKQQENKNVKLIDKLNTLKGYKKFLICVKECVSSFPREISSKERKRMSVNNMSIFKSIIGGNKKESSNNSVNNTYSNANKSNKNSNLSITNINSKFVSKNNVANNLSKFNQTNSNNSRKDNDNDKSYSSNESINESRENFKSNKKLNSLSNDKVKNIYKNHPNTNPNKNTRKTNIQYDDCFVNNQENEDGISSLNNYIKTYETDVNNKNNNTNYHSNSNNKVASNKSNMKIMINNNIGNIGNTGNMGSRNTSSMNTSNIYDNINNINNNNRNNLSFNNKSNNTDKSHSSSRRTSVKYNRNSILYNKHLKNIQNDNKNISKSHVKKIDLNMLTPKERKLYRIKELYFSDEPIFNNPQELKDEFMRLENKNLSLLEEFIRLSDYKQDLSDDVSLISKQQNDIEKKIDTELQDKEARLKELKLKNKELLMKKQKLLYRDKLDQSHLNNNPFNLIQKNDDHDKSCLRYLNSYDFKVKLSIIYSHSNSFVKSIDKSIRMYNPEINTNAYNNNYNSNYNISSHILPEDTISIFAKLELVVNYLQSRYVYYMNELPYNDVSAKIKFVLDEKKKQKILMENNEKQKKSEYINKLILEKSNRLYIKPKKRIPIKLKPVNNEANEQIRKIRNENKNHKHDFVNLITYKDI